MGQTVTAYHTIQINEQWRESAAFVLRAPGCESGAIHLYREGVYYRYFTGRVRPDLRLIDPPDGAAADLSNEPVTPSQVVEYHEAFVGKIAPLQRDLEEKPQGSGADVDGRV